MHLDSSLARFRPANDTSAAPAGDRGESGELTGRSILSIVLSAHARSCRVAMGSTLVLGGGGLAGIAWITGLLAGLAEAGQDLTGADQVIGTSAGATVAAQLGSGLGLDELFARQAEPALQSRELMVELDLAKFGADIQPYMARAVSPDDMLRQFGRFALDAQTVPEAERRAVVEGRLAAGAWAAQATEHIAGRRGS